ncbi:MAG: dienelactone hydrolase family protein [Planctomycetes bacterium]|nr:dienelactone hydrolase family protein [Planctomycetota bacterium]
MTERIELEGPGASRLGACWSRARVDSGAPASALLCLHGADALSARPETRRERLLELSASVLELDLGPGQRALAGGDRELAAGVESALAWLERRADVDARRTAVIGFGTGGTLALIVGSTSRRARAIVAVQGAVRYSTLDAAHPIQPHELALNLDVPLLAVFGARDARVADGDLEQFERSMAQAMKHVELLRFPSCGPDFHDASSAHYRVADAERFWSCSAEFLRRVLE